MRIDNNNLLWRWIELLSFDISLHEASRLRLEYLSHTDPQGFANEIKMRLAKELAARFDGSLAAHRAESTWRAIDAARRTGSSIDASLLDLLELTVPVQGLRIAALLTAVGLTPSNSEANRKVKERAVKVDGQVIEDPSTFFIAGFDGVLALGKKKPLRVKLIAE